jgi:hypothetical protein
VEPLHPLAKQWDRLSPFPTYMLMLRGPVKVDFLFLERPNPPAPPWEVTPETLPAIDAHFWDWMLWLVSKRDRSDQLQLMYEHLLAPMGVAQPPRTAREALASYLERRQAPSALEREVRPTVEAALEA